IVPPLFDLVQWWHPAPLRGPLKPSGCDGLSCPAPERKILGQVNPGLRAREPDQKRVDIGRIAPGPELAATERGRPRSAEGIENSLVRPGVTLEQFLNEMKGIRGREP